MGRDPLSHLSSSTLTEHNCLPLCIEGLHSLAGLTKLVDPFIPFVLIPEVPRTHQQSSVHAHGVTSGRWQLLCAPTRPWPPTRASALQSSHVKNSSLDPQVGLVMVRRLLEFMLIGHHPHRRLSSDLCAGCLYLLKLALPMLFHDLRCVVPSFLTLA